MANKILLTTSVATLAFLLSGVLILAFTLLAQRTVSSTPTEGKAVIRNILYSQMPLTTGLVNAGFIFLTFLLTLPGLLMQSTRGWLKLSGYAVAFCAVFTMCVGVYLWVMTLKIGEDLEGVYAGLESDVQELVQTSFECCGYRNSTSPAFVTNEVCPSPAAAALLRGCQTAVANFGNVELDDIFTALFGVVGVDVVFIMAIACLHKDRKEREWYRRVDQKKSYW